MMATELPLPETADAKHEAIVALHRAIRALEDDDSTCARNHCVTALHWMRDTP